MSLIKELIDLSAMLEKRVTDRTMLDAFLPIKSKIIEVQQEMFELEKRHADAMIALNKTHREELDRLTSVIAKSAAAPELVFLEGLYFRQSELDDKQYYPFCVQCYEQKHKAVRLQRFHAEFVAKWECPSCKTRVK